jgi:hypothetical protein
MLIHLFWFLLAECQSSSLLRRFDIYADSFRVGKNPGFFKKAQPGGFFLGFFGFYWFFLIFVLLNLFFWHVFVLFIYLLADKFKIR